MSEPGGPSAQSGIYYQNSIAALYLCRLCAPLEELEREQVISVRVEAPTNVDDIVVTFSDHHHELIQAKERIEKRGPAWGALWQALLNQSESLDQGDVLWLVVGEPSALASRLREMANRASGALDCQEWSKGFSAPMRNDLASVRKCLPPGSRDDDAWKIFARLRVCVIELESLDSHRCIPRSNRTKAHLLGVLRDKVGGRARYRRSFQAPELLAELDGVDQIQIAEGGEGLPTYRDAIERFFDDLSLPGSPSTKKTLDVFVWPTMLIDGGEGRAPVADDDEYPVGGRPYDLRRFPEEGPKRLAVVAGGGFGKTSLLMAVARTLARSKWVPAFVALPDFAKNDRPLLEYLETITSVDFTCSVSWRQFATAGQLLLLLDGLDELTPAERVNTLKFIRQFSARFPAVPWLLTTRDARTLTVPSGTALARISPLEGRSIRRFCEVYLAGARLDPSAFAERIRTSRELSRLARVPLLLTMMLAFHRCRPSLLLPATRSDLLEGYLEIVLDPNAHRSTTVSTKPRVLRAVAESAALQSLEAPESSSIEGPGRGTLASVCSGNLDTALDDLVACGVMRMNSRTLHFPLPIVREFLAGKSLSKLPATRLLALFEGTLTRPWAEALSFALDEHPDADRLLTSLTDQPDDLFRSRLKIAGRCIANGATVSAATKHHVGSSLGVLWAASDHGVVGQQIADILATGFSDPLPENVRKRLQVSVAVPIRVIPVLSAA